MKSMIIYKSFYWIMIASLLLSSCREIYEIDYEAQDSAPILVMEGYIDAGSTESRYELSYALPLNDKGDGQVSNTPLINALVTIESERGEKYNASGSGSGVYVIPHPVLDQGQQYRLRIRAGQIEYLSDFVPVKISPAIGEVEWERDEDGVQIYLNTADPSNSTRYYRWEYEETWKYFSQVVSKYILDGNSVRLRELHEYLHVCYISDQSSQIYLGTSEELENDVIHRYPLASIPNLSEKLSDRYSILVRQLPLTAEAYSYWKQVQESSQNLGDLFGPMPSELKGNIVCVNNPDFHVIGMVEVLQAVEKRIYINRMDLSEFWPVDNEFFANCLVIDSLKSPNWFAENPIATPVEGIALNPNFPVISGYTYINSKRCIDCRFRGGTYDPPPFWKMK